MDLNVGLTSTGTRCSRVAQTKTSTLHLDLRPSFSIPCEPRSLNPHTCKNQGQKGQSVQKTLWKQTNKQTDRQTQPGECTVPATRLVDDASAARRWEDDTGSTGRFPCYCSKRALHQLDAQRSDYCTREWLYPGLGRASVGAPAGRNSRVDRTSSVTLDRKKIACKPSAAALIPPPPHHQAAPRSVTSFPVCGRRP